MGNFSLIPKIVPIYPPHILSFISNHVGLSLINKLNLLVPIGMRRVRGWKRKKLQYSWPINKQRLKLIRGTWREGIIWHKARIKRSNVFFYRMLFRRHSVLITVRKNQNLSAWLKFQF